MQLEKETERNCVKKRQNVRSFEKKYVKTVGKKWENEWREIIKKQEI